MFARQSQMKLRGRTRMSVPTRISNSLCGVGDSSLSLRMTDFCKPVGVGVLDDPPKSDKTLRRGQAPALPISIYSVPCEILRFAQNDRLLQTRRGGCLHPPVKFDRNLRNALSVVPYMCRGDSRIVRARFDFAQNKLQRTNS